MITLYPVVTSLDCYYVTTCRASKCPCIRGIKRAITSSTSKLPLPRKRQILDVMLFSTSRSTCEFRWKTVPGSTKYPLRFTKHFGVTITFWTYIQALRYRQSYPYNTPQTHIGLWDVEAPTFSRQSAHRWLWRCQPYVPTALYPRKIPGTHFC
jgi:hypothetical protein